MGPIRGKGGPTPGLVRVAASQVKTVAAGGRYTARLRLFSSSGSVDLRIEKRLALPDGHAASFLVEVFNLTNRANVASVSAVAGPAFWTPTTFFPGREVPVACTDWLRAVNIGRPVGRSSADHRPIWSMIIGLLSRES